MLEPPARDYKIKILERNVEAMGDAEERTLQLDPSSQEQMEIEKRSHKNMYTQRS